MASVPVGTVIKASKWCINMKFFESSDFRHIHKCNVQKEPNSNMYICSDYNLQKKKHCSSLQLHERYMTGYMLCLTTPNTQTDVELINNKFTNLDI